MASNVSETTALLTDNNGLRSSLEHAYSTEPIIKPSTTEEATTAIKPASPEPQTTTTWKTELQLLLKHSAPLNVAFILQYALNNFTTIFFVGRVSIESLGAVQLAFMTANVFGFAIYEGLATSLDTLCAQAYGSGRKELVGLHLQRMVYFQWLVTVPIAVVWFCATWILEYVITDFLRTCGGGFRFCFDTTCSPAGAPSMECVYLRQKASTDLDIHIGLSFRKRSWPRWRDRISRS